MDKPQDPESRQKQDPAEEHLAADTSSDDLDDSWDDVDAAEGVEPSVSKEDDVPVEVSQEEEIQQLKKQLERKDDEIVRLCRQASSQATSEEYYSANSTPLPSLIIGDGQSASHTGDKGEVVPTKQVQECLHDEDREGRASTELPYVGRLRERNNKLVLQLGEAEKRAKYFEREYQKAMAQCAKLQIEQSSTNPSGTDEVMSKDRDAGQQNVKSAHKENLSKEDTESCEKDKIITALMKKVRELERAAAALARTQQHSKTQSKQLLDLQDEAKARDSEHFEVQKSLGRLEDYVAEIEESRSEIARERGQLKEQLKKQKRELENLQVLQAEKAERDLEYERSKMKLQSFKEQVKNLKEENAALRKQIVKFGELQTEGHDLSIKVAKLQKQLRVVQEQLRVVTVEKEQLQSTLELTQAQAMVYKEDFETERKDRERAFSERNEERERYKDEIDRLQTLLNSHKGNLSDLEKVHISRQKEMMQVMEDLKKAQEDVQAKTSQVKQYKKQCEGLVTKVNTLERDNEELVQQFETVRKQLENAKKSSKYPHNDAELIHARTELEKLTKRADKYMAKSRSRKSQLAKLEKAYKDDLQKVKREAEKLRKERKKSSSEVNISSPISSSDAAFPVDIQQYCQTLENEIQELKAEVGALKRTNELLNSLLSGPLSSDDDSDERPTVATPIQQDDERTMSSPDELLQESTRTARKATTGVLQKTTQITTRQRSSSATSTMASQSLLHSKQTVSGRNATRYQAKHQLTHSQQQQQHRRAATAENSTTDEQYADYVNQSRIQAMIDANKKPLPASLPSPPAEIEESMTLPPPIVDYNGKEEKMVQIRKGTAQHVQWTMEEGRAAEGGVGGRCGEGGQDGKRRGSAPESVTRRMRESHEAQHQLYNQSGPTSLPAQQTSSLAHQYSIGSGQPPQQSGVGAHRREVTTKESKQHLGDDVLTPGINTEVHKVARGMIDGIMEGEGREVTGVPYDPNLTCVVCRKVFRIGEIQIYRNHTATCGTVV